MFCPDKLPEFPPDAEKTVPADVWAKIQAYKNDSALSVAQKREHIHNEMMKLPDDVLDKLEPKECANLPNDLKQKLKAIHRQRDMPFEKKKEQMDALIKTLPQEQQKQFFSGKCPLA